MRAVLQAQRETFVNLGCAVEDVSPDLSGAEEGFLTLRAWHYWHTLGPLLASHRAQMKPEAVWQIEAGRELSGSDVAGAMSRHGDLMQSFRRFQQSYDFVACAVNQVPPFDAAIAWPTEIDGVPMDNYLSWMKSAYWITPTFSRAFEMVEASGGEWRPEQTKLVVLAMYHVVVGYFAIAPLYHQLSGEDLLSPDLDRRELEAIVEVIERLNIDGIIATNTTVSRDNLRTDAKRVAAFGEGGLSGKPLKDASTRMIATLYELTDGRIPLIGVGGIFNAEDAWEKIAAGASLVQLYTGFIYQGPRIAQQINKDLAKILEREGFANLEEAVGCHAKELGKS